MINTKVETARNDLSTIHDTFHRKQRCKSSFSKFKDRRCCVSVIMRPAGYLISLHVVQGASWVWDPCNNLWFAKLNTFYLARYHRGVGYGRPINHVLNEISSRLASLLLRWKAPNTVLQCWALASRSEGIHLWLPCPSNYRKCSI